MVKVQFIKKYGLEIPTLKNRPIGVTFPLLNYSTMVPLPEEEQVMEVTDKEAHDLVGQGHFKVVKEKKAAKKVEKKEVDDNGEDRV